MPPKQRSYDAVVRAAERALEAAGVDHVFVGGLAVLAFGRTRTTEDVDVLAAFRERDIVRLVKEFSRRGLRVSEWELEAALTEGGHCTIDDTRSTYRVDLAPIANPAAAHTLRHRVSVRSKGMALPLAAPEDTIVVKLRFGSEQDLEDALAIYVRQRARLNEPRLVAFAAQLRVSSALAALRRRAEDLERAEG